MTATPAHTPGRLLPGLTAISGAPNVLTDPDLVAAHVTDWTGRFRGTSPAVVRPGTVDEVAAIVNLCRELAVALVPQGGNTGLVAGGVPLDGEVVLHLGRLREIVVDPVVGQVTAGAGATLRAVQDAAAEAGWRYPVDFGARDSATIGGSVATNAGGLRVVRHGMTSRHLLGVPAGLGTSDAVSRLGGLVKDNTGYDLAQLLCGSEGTLGVVTTARLALVPPPGDVVTALIGCESLAAAVALTTRLRVALPTLEAAEVVLADGAARVAQHSGVPPVISPIPPVMVLVEAVGPPDPARALAEVLESVPTTAVAVAEDARRAARLWHVREAHTEVINRVGVPSKFDVSVPGAALPDFVTQVQRTVVEVDPNATVWVFGHLGDGNLHVNVTGHADTNVEAIADAVLWPVLGAGGSVSAEHGVGRLKRRWLHHDRGSGDLAAMAAVKDALDPDGICNPHVLVPAGRFRA